MKHIPLQGMEAAMALAAQAVAAQQNRPGERGDGVAMVSALREALQTIIQAASFVTYIQNPEDPLIVINDDGETPEINPAELLRRLADAWEITRESEWESEVEAFKTAFRNVQGEAESERFKKMFPGDITISDILGEGK